MKGKANINDLPEPLGGMAITENGRVFRYTDGYGKTAYYPEGIKTVEFKATHNVLIEIPHNGRVRTSV